MNRRDPNNFLSRLVSMEETWLHQYYARTKSNSQWSGGKCHTPPQILRAKNPLEDFSPRFFGIKTSSSSLIRFLRADFSTRSIIHSFWCNWRIFWRKNYMWSTERKSCSCTTMSGSPGICKTEEPGLHGLPMPSSNTLVSVSRLDWTGLDWKWQTKIHHSSSET